MAPKPVLHAAVGVLVGDGRLLLDAPPDVPGWDDARAAITLDQLLRASSGLAFDEHYGTTNDVSRMLFTEPDTGAFAARSAGQKPNTSPMSRENPNPATGAHVGT